MRKVVLTLIALLAAACSPPATEEAAQADPDMTMAPGAPAQAGAVASTGTVTAVDAAAGTITINHEPIAAISWPAMTMQFTAENPSILQGIAVGDHVAFELKSTSETSTVTVVQKQ